MSCCPPPPPQVKEAPSLLLGSPFYCRKRERSLGLTGPLVTQEGSRWKTRQRTGSPLTLPRGTPLTSVCAYVGLETVVILVLLATDSTLIGPWKQARKGLLSQHPKEAAMRPQCLRGCLRGLLALLKGQGSSIGRIVPSKQRGSRAQQRHPRGHGRGTW